MSGTGAARDAMRDVEIADGDGVLGTAGTDPATDAELARRMARRRRRVLRWWPLPAAAAVLLVGGQLVLDARERTAVAERQEVPGVLRTVDPALEPIARLPATLGLIAVTGVDAGRLRVDTGQPGSDEVGDLVAVDSRAREVWRTSLQTPGRDAGVGVVSATCLGDAVPATAVRCLVLDGLATTGQTDGPLPAPSAARLVTVDSRTGAVRATRDLPAASALGGADGLQVIASVVDDDLRVTAWDTGTVPDGPDSGDGSALWDVTTGLDAAPAGGALTAAPHVQVSGHHVLVRTYLAVQAFGARDGSREVDADEHLVVTRTGHLAVLGRTTTLVDPGRPAARPLPGIPVTLTVDDGSAPGAEFLLSFDGVPRTLTAYDVAANAPLWSAEHHRWRDGLVLLDGVLYGSDREAVWAVDATTGRELWRTPTAWLSESGDMLTDGRYLLTVGSVDPLGPGASALLAFDLSSGERRWATSLPDGVESVWTWEDGLFGVDREGVVLLN